MKPGSGIQEALHFFTIWVPGLGPVAAEPVSAPSVVRSSEGPQESPADFSWGKMMKHHANDMNLANESK